MIGEGWEPNPNHWQDPNWVPNLELHLGLVLWSPLLGLVFWIPFVTNVAQFYETQNGSCKVGLIFEPMWML